MKLPRLFSSLKRRFFASKTVARLAALALPLLGTATATLAQTAPNAPAANSYVSEWQAVILGLVQGLTEFIPVSSSAHLNITHALMGHGRDLSFDVMLSIGTTLALGWYYRHDWRGLLFDPAQKKLRNLVFLACVPAVLLAFPIHQFEERPPLSEAWFNATMLLVAGAILLIADKTSPQTRDLTSVSAKDSILVGIGQALALIPGVSRSGATLTAGRLLGFNREDAMRFSFLMSLPISIGAIVFKVKDFGDINAPVSSLVLGVVASAVSGFWAIGFLLNFLKTRDVTPFFIWRAGVALVVLFLASRGVL
jgi:undecaprenyl-diphosphatase